MTVRYGTCCAQRTLCSYGAAVYALDKPLALTYESGGTPCTALRVTQLCFELLPTVPCRHLQTKCSKHSVLFADAAVRGVLCGNTMGAFTSMLIHVVPLSTSSTHAGANND
jgi:hypothetical protein